MMLQLAVQQPSDQFKILVEEDQACAGLMLGFASPLAGFILYVKFGVFGERHAEQPGNEELLIMHRMQRLYSASGLGSHAMSRQPPEISVSVLLTSFFFLSLSLSVSSSLAPFSCCLFSICLYVHT